MGNIGVSWTIAEDVYFKLREEAKKSGKSTSYLATHHIRAFQASQDKKQFYRCWSCGEMKATEINGLCPKCLKEAHRKTEKEADETIAKIQNIYDEKKQEESKTEVINKNNQLVTDLLDNLKIKSNIVNRYLSDPEKYKETLGEDEFNQRINNYNDEIYKIKAELKDLGFIPEEN